MSQMVKLLGDTSYGLNEDVGGVAQQVGGLGKLAYGLAKVSQYGLSKISQYSNADELTFKKADKFGRSDTLAYQNPIEKARARAKVARAARTRKRRRFSFFPTNSVITGRQQVQGVYGNGTKGLTKSAQPAGGIAKPRTAVRTGRVAKTREQFLKSSYQMRPNIGKKLLKIFQI